MRLLPALALFAALSAALSAPAFAEPPVPTLTVSGEGRVSVAPDMATVTVGVVTEADTAKQALEANNALLATTLARLKSSAIEDRDIQTTGLSLGPRYDYNRTKPDGTAQITGFIASNNVTVRVRALPGLGEVLDAVVSDGANTLGGVTFGLQNPDPVTDEARKAAVADARHKAELYAAAAGVTLGQIQSISEQTGYSQPVPMAEASFKAASPVPVQAGEVDVTADVTIVWQIGN
jgi:uncharacterized protein YggE